MKPNYVGKQKAQRSSILPRDPSSLCRLLLRQFLELAQETTSSGSRSLHGSNETSVLSWAKVRTTMSGKATLGQEAMFIKLCLWNKSLIDSGGLIAGRVMPREEVNDSHCLSKSSVLGLPVSAELGIFRSSLPTLFIWSLYNENQERPPGSHSWNPSPGTNSWNLSSVGGKLPGFCKILPPG